MAACVDFLMDPTTRTVVDDTWCRAARQEGFTRVRAAIAADASGRVPWDLVQRGALAWKRAGVAVDVVLAYEYLPPFKDIRGTTHYMNEPVGTGTHKLTTPYVERFRLDMQAQAPSLIAAGIDGVYAGNEPQVGLVLPGDNCPPGTRIKRDHSGHPLDENEQQVPWGLGSRINDSTLNRSCLAPENYATLVWQTCHSMEKVGMPRRIAGAFNVRRSTGLDNANPYMLAYLGHVYAHLKLCGVKPNWTHLGLTIYGYWDQPQVQNLHDTVLAYMRSHGDHADLVCAEYGVENAEANIDAFLRTRDALTAVFGDPAFFQRPGRDPYLGDVNLYPGYGAVSWRAANGRFILGARYPLGHALLG